VAKPCQQFLGARCSESFKEKIQRELDLVDAFSVENNQLGDDADDRDPPKEEKKVATGP